MKQRVRNIGRLFLLLAGLVILLHSTIPHHHDSDTHFETKSSECSSHKTNGSSSNHCHAFNDVVAEKVGSQKYNLQATTTFIFVSVPNFTTIIAESDAETVAFVSYNVVPLKQYFTTQLSFRGPPVLA